MCLFYVFFSYSNALQANILVSETGVACLADFGLSRIMEADLDNSNQSFNVGGATRWVAREIICEEESSDSHSPVASPRRSGVPDPSQLQRTMSQRRTQKDVVVPASDVWSYGMLMYEVG